MNTNLDNIIMRLSNNYCSNTNLLFSFKSQQQILKRLEISYEDNKDKDKIHKKVTLLKDYNFQK